MTKKYIDAEKLKSIIKAHLKERDEWMKDPDKSDRQDQLWADLNGEDVSILLIIDSLQKEQDRMRYCIEYVNPQYPLLDNGELNIRHLRVPDEHGAEMALTLMLSLGAKIYRLYRGNVQEGKLAEWPTPMIVDADDWYSTEWLHNILD